MGCHLINDIDSDKSHKPDPLLPNYMFQNFILENDAKLWWITGWLPIGSESTCKHRFVFRSNQLGCQLPGTLFSNSDMSKSHSNHPLQILNWRRGSTPPPVPKPSSMLFHTRSHQPQRSFPSFYGMSTAIMITAITSVLYCPGLKTSKIFTTLALAASVTMVHTL